MDLKSIAFNNELKTFYQKSSWRFTSLGEERANLAAFRAFVRSALVWSCLFPLPFGVWEGLRFVIVALLDFSLFSDLYLPQTLFSNTVLQAYMASSCGIVVYRDVTSKISNNICMYLLRFGYDMKVLSSVL